MPVTIGVCLVHWADHDYTTCPRVQIARRHTSAIASDWLGIPLAKGVKKEVGLDMRRILNHNSQTCNQSGNSVWECVQMMHPTHEHTG
jgi:hypothetical protein